MVITLTSTQFNTVKDKLKTTPDVELVETTPTTGTLTTKDVILVYDYIENRLSVTIVKRKSWEADLASDTMIFNKLQTLLAQCLD